MYLLSCVLDLDPKVARLALVEAVIGDHEPRKPEVNQGRRKRLIAPTPQDATACNEGWLDLDRGRGGSHIGRPRTR